MPSGQHRHAELGRSGPRLRRDPATPMLESPTEVAESTAIYRVTAVMVLSWIKFLAVGLRCVLQGWSPASPCTTPTTAPATYDAR